MIFYPHIRSSTTITKHLSWKTLNPKCDKNKNIRIAKFSNLKMKMRLRIKKFPSKLYPLNIDVCFKHQNT